MIRTLDYRWLEHFWTKVVSPNPPRRWQVMSLYDRDLFLRDGIAHALIRERLHGRRDVEYRCVRAWGKETPEQIPSDVEYLFLGRLQPYGRSRYATVVDEFEKATYGEFLDPGYPGGELGHTVTYNGRLFNRHALGESYDAAPYRRSDIDYGILLFWNQNHRARVAISGLGSLGTLCLTVILTRDSLRRRLVDQARKLLPDDSTHHPEQQIELCVRCRVRDEGDLANLLPNLCALQPDDERCPFDFRVEAIAVKTIGGKAIKVQEPEPLELLVRSSRNGEEGGEVRTATTEWKKLPRRRFSLLRSLVEEPESSNIDALCDLLFGSLDSISFENEEQREAEEKRRRVRLAKLVHDLNENLKKDVLLGGREKPIIRFHKRDDRYAFAGVKARIT
jgi:hypothetical protein